MDTKSKKDRYLNFSGCSQPLRKSKALQEGYVQIDEKGYNENLVYAYGLSKLINYFNSNGEIDGDWSDFLIDEAVVLAAISSVKPSEIESHFKTNYQKTMTFNNLAKKELYLGKTFLGIYEISKKIDIWYQNLKIVEDFINDEVNIRNEIANIILNKLRPALQKYVSFVLGANSKNTISTHYDYDFSSFSTLWELQNIESSEVIYEGKNKSAKIDSACDSLQLLFQEFYEAIIHIRQKAKDYLEQSLQSDHHFPEVALLLSFLELYKYPQKQINELTKKYQDYYYRNILQQKEQEARNAEVYLSFLLDNEVNRARIEKGEKFIAGADSSGKSIFFESNYEFEVNKAQLQSLKNIFLEKTNIPVGNEVIKYVENIYCNELPVFGEQENDVSQQLKSYPVFGEKQKGRGETDRNMDFASIGFAIASPALHLKEGKREVDLVLNLKEESYKLLLEEIYRFGKYLNISRKEMVVKAFLEAFIIEISGENGWLKVKRYVVSLDEETYSVIIKFDVSPDQPPIVGLDSEIHNEEFESKYPVIRVLINNQSYIYPYFLFNSSVIEQIAIKTAVSGVKELVIHNNVGPVNQDNPFLPFGPVPNVGSYMIIGSNEVFQKQLEDLKINIEWFDVPKENRGFAEYYREYGTNVNNASFEADISVLNGGVWTEEKQTIKLFRTKGKEDKNEPDLKSKVSSLLPIKNLDIGQIRQEPNYKQIKGTQLYTSQAKRGFIKLELKGPQHAFGHSVYPNILSEVTMENAKTGFLKGSKKKPLPQQPITPKIKTLTIDYKSSAVISMKDGQTVDPEILNEQGQLFHIHPFGKVKVFPNRSAKNIHLIPDYDFEGALFLGFKDIMAPQTISVLFEMLDEFTISSEEEPPEIEWSFLANNTWYPIKPVDIIRDDTNGFLRTGIIMVNVPGDINRANTVLNSELFWLKVSVKANVEGASNIISAASQVVKATLIGNDELYRSGFLDKNLPKETIQRPLKNLKGVRKVSQPLPSFKGRSFENEQSFNTRSSERLKHRNRAVTNWDFERIILNRFPQIERATCLPNMTSGNLSAPGNVLIVVSPFAEQVVNTKEPRTSSELLYEIKSYLKKYTSPFVSLEVRNPSYERIRVICSVKFTEMHNHGYYIQQLNEHINNYLNGNMGGSSHGSLVGKVVYCSDVITYIRTLPFIQFVTRFSIVQAARDISGNYVLLDTAKEGDEKDGLKATKPWSVLVPSEQHQITVIIDRKEEQSKQAGIDYLELGSDFIIND